MSRHLRFAPEILARLGEELVPHPDLGVMELVRNAYDADATICAIRLLEADRAGGTLIVEDDGTGMDEDSIYDSFLLLGRSAKTSSPITPGGRRKVGEKGLGRLAALRLGAHVELETRPARTPGQAHVLSIDWTKYDSVHAVEDVPLTVINKPTSEPPGTRVTISQLREPFAEADIKRMARSVLLLTGPFPENSSFRAIFVSEEFDKLLADTSRAYLDQADFRLFAEIDGEGYAKATLYDWRGDVLHEAGHDLVALNRKRGGRDVHLPFELAPRASLELWMFLKGGKSLSPLKTSPDRDRVWPWLDVVGGVHLIHRGLRVTPYGDPGNDWLELNARRTGSPEERPSTRTAVGRVVVDDDTQILQPKTDRTGFVETPAFVDLREFAIRATDWAAAVRLKDAEVRRREQVPKTRTRMKTAEDELRKTVRTLPPRYREIVERQVNTYRGETQQHVKAVERDLRLYRTLSTLGTSTAVFAHEVLGPASRLTRMVRALGQLIGTKVDQETYDAVFDEPMSRIGRSLDTVQAFANLSLEMVKKRKRDSADVDVDEVCREVVKLFSPYFNDRNISVRTEFDAQTMRVRSTVAEIEAIWANLLTNSAHALLRQDMPDRDREILIRTQSGEESVVLTVDDSGPGIQDMPIDEIWSPGRTSRTDGTGLGLTIVRDVVEELKGKNLAFEKGELGGARIMVRLPAQPARAANKTPGASS
ncbi:ATP-binding protein [Streptomyces sp. NPDC047706]|uniref:sensor histidine kinase n=1 Tax=Streptomyces sp. NPDC047706 TaxID=3365486 RepID=UPI0037230794